MEEEGEEEGEDVLVVGQEGIEEVFVEDVVREVGREEALVEGEEDQDLQDLRVEDVEDVVVEEEAEEEVEEIR
tara:strand:+ start:254 stop:472 length:219 start_codon:yes stop_codon:yes gene_type:complete